MEFLIDGEDDAHAAALEAALTVVDDYLSFDGYHNAASSQDRHAASIMDTSVSLDEFLVGDEEELFPLEELTASCGIVDPLSSPIATGQAGNAHEQLQPRSEMVVAKKPQGSKPSGKRTITWDPNKARNERKGELIYLRKKVSELEAQLCDIKANKKPRIAASSRSRTTPCPCDGVHAPPTAAAATTTGSTEPATNQLKFTIPSHAVRPSLAEAYVWQEIANRQCSERVRSERENIRLKLVLENQLKIAKSLEKHLKRATTTIVRGTISCVCCRLWKIWRMDRPKSSHLLLLFSMHAGNRKADPGREPQPREPTRDEAHEC